MVPYFLNIIEGVPFTWGFIPYFILGSNKFFSSLYSSFSYYIFVKVHESQRKHCKMITFRYSLKRTGTTYRNITNYDLTYPPILGRKSGFPPILSNMLDNFGGGIGGEIGEKIGRFLNRKIGGVAPHRFSCHTHRFFKKKIGRLPPIPESVAVCVNRWKKSFDGN